MAIQDSLNKFGDQAYVDPMGRAATNTAAIYEPAQQDQTQAAFARGLDPSSGAYQTESQALSDAKGRAIGLSSAGAGLSNTDQAYQGIANMVRVGQGLQTDSMEGNVSLAQGEIDRAGVQATKDFNRSASLQSIAGTGAGVATGYGLGGG